MSVNPYRTMNIYGPDYVKIYKGNMYIHTCMHARCVLYCSVVSWMTTWSTLNHLQTLTQTLSDNTTIHLKFLSIHTCMYVCILHPVHHIYIPPLIIYKIILDTCICYRNACNIVHNLELILCVCNPHHKQ